MLSWDAHKDGFFSSFPPPSRSVCVDLSLVGERFPMFLWVVFLPRSVCVETGSDLAHRETVG